jgi:hypothetical protein
MYTAGSDCGDQRDYREILGMTPCSRGAGGERLRGGSVPEDAHKACQRACGRTDAAAIGATGRTLEGRRPRRKWVRPPTEAAYSLLFFWGCMHRLRDGQRRCAVRQWTETTAALRPGVAN